MLNERNSQIEKLENEIDERTEDLMNTNENLSN
jgi:hypothetical protein